jgi:hypothetical protein
MAVWNPIFLQEFPDRDLNNFHAVEGQLLRSTPPPTIGPSGSGVLVGVDEWLGFELANQVESVIGVYIELSVDVRYRVSESPVSIFLGSNEPLVAGLLSVGDQFRVFVQIAAQDFLDSNRDATDTVDAKLVVHSGGSTLTYDQLHLSHRKTQRLRLNWHTNGQLRVWQNQALVAYASDFAPSSKATVDRFTLGVFASGASDDLQKRFDHFYLKLLREEDAVEAVAGEFPSMVSYLPPEIRDDPLLERCKALMLRNTLQTLDRYRAFMSKFSQSTTTNWQSGSDAASPFSRASIDAHRLSNEAFLHVISYLQDPGPIHAQHAVEKMTQFFEILHNQLPDEFRGLVSDLNDPGAELPYECRELADQIAAVSDTQQPIVSLLHQIQQAAAEVASGGSNG